VNSPRIQTKSKHELMMDKVWTKFDHVESQKREWAKNGAYISRHEERFKPLHSEDERKELRKTGRRKDEALAERLKSISKTGNAGIRTGNAGLPAELTVANVSHTKGSELGGAKAVAWSVVRRFGQCPFDQVTELMKAEMVHVGPGTYVKATEASSIRARTSVSTNHSAAFVPGTPRFGRKRRVDVSDGGAARRMEKEEREKREAEIQQAYHDGVEVHGGAVTTR